MTETGKNLDIDSQKARDDHQARKSEGGFPEAGAEVEPGWGHDEKKAESLAFTGQNRQELSNEPTASANADPHRTTSGGDPEESARQRISTDADRIAQLLKLSPDVVNISVNVGFNTKVSHSQAKNFNSPPLFWTESKCAGSC